MSRRTVIFAIATAVSASACWLVAGTDDFSDEPAAGGNSATSSASGASSGKGGAQTSTGGQGGVGGVGGVGGTAGSGGQGGGSPCAPGTNKPNGECCNDFGECASTFCADGFCCNTVCAQSCFSCGESGSLGNCIDACVTVTLGENSGDDVVANTRDTFVHDNFPNRNHGGTAYLWANNNPDYNALIGFDLSGLPSGATIGESILYLYVESGSTLSFGIYEILEDWDENNLDGTTGIANWDSRIGNITWTTPGCGATGSSSATALASFTPSMVGQYIQRNIDHNLVQRWFDTPATNYGVTIRAISSGTDQASLTSSEGMDGQRPYLQVKYRP